MQSTPLLCLRPLPALLLGLWAGASHGAAFQLQEQNASGLGNAYAGSAAVAENASTVYFNPAGMTELAERSFSVGATSIHTRYVFHDQGSSVGALGSAADGVNGGATGTLPNAYLSWALNPDVRLGLGMGAPFGLKTEYNNPWQGGAQSVRFEIKTLNLNPSAAWKVNEQLSLGAGINWQRLEAEYTRDVAVVPLAGGLIPARAAAGTTTLLQLKGESWGWNAGLLYTLNPSTRIGVAYRSALHYHLHGDNSFSGSAATALNSFGLATQQKASLNLPDTFTLSLVHQLNPQWAVLGDLSRTGWSSIPKLDIIRTSGSSAGSISQTLHTDFRDSWRAALGLTQQYSPSIKLKYGIAYDQTPVKGASTRLVSLPDNNRVWLSLGGQWKPDAQSSVDLGLARLFIADARIDNNQLADGRGRVTGSYQDSAWLFGLQYSRAF